MKLCKLALLTGLAITVGTPKAAAQSSYNKARIDSIVKVMLLTRTVDHYSFADKLKLTGVGYNNANYTYAVDKKTKKVAWVKVWYKSQEQSDLYYFNNNKLIKAIIGIYRESQPRTTFYFWNDQLVLKEPNSAILNWKAFIEIGYGSLQRVKKYIGNKI